MDITEIVITAVLGLFSAIIIRFWDFIWKTFEVEEGMDVMRKTMDTLKARLVDVNVKLSKAELEQKACIHEVKLWMQRVESIEGEVTQTSNKFSEWKSDYRGFYSYLIFWKRISISYEVLKKLKEVNELHEQGVFKDVATELPPRAAQEMPCPPRLRAMDSNHDEILHQLLNNDDVEIIGIWGMGGVGKTTLLKVINNYFANQNKPTSFDRVIFVVASKNVSLDDVQNRILANLGLPSMPSGDMDSGATKLLSFMNRKRVLLLLDDLWEHVELHLLGIPLGRGKCKVVFTTRAVDVCDSMKANIKIKVECLDKVEAWNLFKEKVGENIIESDSNIRRLANQVAEECRGLPLALVTIARAMSARKTWREWQDGLCSLHDSKAEEISDIPNKMFPKLEFSYQNLENDTMRKCFLSCSLWPDDFVIPRLDLVRCWMGLELIDDYNEIDEAFDRGHAIIETLISKCLLETVQDYYVKVHDVLRDLALWIASDHGKDKKKWMVKSNIRTGRWKPEDWESAERISAMFGTVQSLPEKLCNCPRLSVLIICYCDFHSVPGGHFQYWSALTYLDLSNSGLLSLPADIAKLINLKFLNLENNPIECLPNEFSALMNLKYLLLGCTNINPIPWGLISKLPLLKMLDLFDCGADLGLDGLEVLEKLDRTLMGLGIKIATLSALERLSMLHTVSIVKLVIHKLEGLDYLELLAPTLLGRKATGGSLQCFSIRSCESLKLLVVNALHIGGFPRETSLSRLEALDLLGLPLLEKIEWSGVTAKELLPSLRMLMIYECPKLKNVSWVYELPNIEILDLSHCNELEIVIDNGGEQMTAVFPRLRSMRLTSLPNLRRICSTLIHCPSLEHITVWNCPQLKKLPFKAPNLCGKLRRISGPSVWCQQLEWEDDNTKSLLKDYLHSY